MRRSFVRLKSFCVSDKCHYMKVFADDVLPPKKEIRETEFTQPREVPGRTKC